MGYVIWRSETSAAVEVNSPNAVEITHGDPAILASEAARLQLEAELLGLLHLGNPYLFEVE